MFLCDSYFNVFIVVIIFFFFIGITTEQMPEIRSKQIENKKRETNSSQNSTKSYPCNVCLKTYKHPNSLNKHLRSHLSPENRVLYPFQCDNCDKKFAKIQNMKTHRALVHSILEMN